MKRLTTCLMITVAAIAFGTGAAFGASNVITLRVAHFMTAGSNFQQKILLPWCDKVNKESGGRLKCQIYPSMQLGGSPPQLFDQGVDGIADIVETIPTYQAGRFTKSEVFELPFMIKNSENGSPALWDYIQKNALDEYRGVKLLFVNFHDGNQLFLGKKSVKTLEDLKGLKVRAPSRLAARTLAELGAIPVQIPMPSVPESIAKGVVDGASIPWEISTSIKLQEICKTITETGPGQAKHANSIFVFAMNATKYNSLPPELKKVIDQNSGVETSRWAGKILDGTTAAARKIAVERHDTINVLSSAEYKRWVKVTKPVFNEWIKEVNAKGGNGTALLNEARALLKKYND